VNAAVAATAALGTIDIVVNNAGIEVFGPVHLLADDEMLRQFDTNLFGVVRVCRAVMPYMLDNGGGTIVNVGSLAGLVGYPYSGIYSASKHAIEAISESMHFELSQRGIRVRVVEPGQFATELGQNSCTARGMEEGGPDHLRMLRFRTALRGLVNGQPAPAQEVADAIYAAATETPGRLRHPVGADADLVLATKRVMTFEEFDTTMRSALQWFD
jgi:NAD(P)-dependent dehydrogenase (short-subunit alcohol dehydrogenase family)